ncbi:MAG: hypothetical protein ACXVYB_00375 [Arthrobacter sp.]
MNYFLELKLHEKDRSVFVRPEHVSAVEPREGYVSVTLLSGDNYWVEESQFSLNKLINHTGHAGMRVI